MVDLRGFRVSAAQIRRPARAPGVLGPERSTGPFRPFGFESPKVLYRRTKTPTGYHLWVFSFVVDLRGFEPLTSTLPVWRAPNCAKGP